MLKQTVSALPDTLPVEGAASFFVNPYTPLEFLTPCEPLEATVLCTLPLRPPWEKLCAKQKCPRQRRQRQEQADMLKKLGAQYVVVTNKDETEWKPSLKIIES